MSVIINIPQVTEAKVLSKHQKIFNANIKKISKFKLEIEEAKALLKYTQIEIALKFEPLEKEENEIRVILLKTFDRLLDEGKFSKRERETMSRHIWEEANKLIEEGQDELKPLFEKYDEDNQSYDEFNEEKNKEGSEMIKSYLKSMGIDFEGDIDMANPAASQAQILEQLKAKEQEAYFEQQNKQKSAKQLEKEAKKQEAENKLGQSIKEIYKKLVKEFHPDREQDEAEKIRKTEVMSRITEAYEKNDLLTLLQLQLEYEQISENSINEISDEKLAIFNKVLRDQVRELEATYEMIVGRGNPMHPFNRLMVYQVNKPTIDLKIKQEIKQMKKLNKSLKEDLEYIKADIKNFKSVIKSIGKEQYDSDNGPDFMSLFQHLR